MSELVFNVGTFLIIPGPKLTCPPGLYSKSQQGIGSRGNILTKSVLDPPWLPVGLLWASPAREPLGCVSFYSLRLHENDRNLWIRNECNVHAQASLELFSWEMRKEKTKHKNVVREEKDMIRSF